MNRIKVHIRNTCHQLENLMFYGDLPTWYYRKRGMKVGIDFNRQSGTKFDPLHCYLIEIGNHVTIANYVQFLAHDHAAKLFAGHYKIGKIVIGDYVFIGARTLILPNVRIGDHVLIAAGSVVTRDIPANCVAAGVPARVISTIEEYTKKCEKEIRESSVLENIYAYGKHLPAQKKEEIKEACKESARYIRGS